MSLLKSEDKGEVRNVKDDLEDEIPEGMHERYLPDNTRCI